MGNIIYYLNRENKLSDISKGRWKVMRRVIDILLDYLNSAMHKDWSSREFRNIIVQINKPNELNFQSSQSLPSIGKFILENILDDLSDKSDEIIFINSAELKRLFQWCDFLKERDGSFEFFVPLIDVLHQKTADIDLQTENLYEKRN